LRLGGEGVEAVIGGLDLDDSTLGFLEQFRFGAAALAFGLREEAAVGKASSAVAKLG
jgi:hypothetical protein